MSKRDGYTLVEVVISILLTSVLVSAVFSVALTAKAGSGKADRKLLGGDSLRALDDALKAYVTDSSSNFATSAGQINGPNHAARGNFSQQAWNIYTPGVQEDHQCSFPSGFNAGPPSIGGQQDIYALATSPPGGYHCLVCVAAPPNDTPCFLPKILRDPPYNGSIYYQVTGSPPKVQVGVWWTEPAP